MQKDHLIVVTDEKRASKNSPLNKWFNFSDETLTISIKSCFLLCGQNQLDSTVSFLALQHQDLLLKDLGHENIC